MKNGLAMTATGRKEVVEEKCLWLVRENPYLNHSPDQLLCKGRVFVYYLPYLFSA
jgi:hypothetical protein